jgi:hypothetical protein
MLLFLEIRTNIWLYTLSLVVKGMENEELAQLKTVYDELWSDAKTMIKDMKRSISIYFFTGFITLALSVVITVTAISDWNKILSGSASTLTYFYAIAETLGAVSNVAFGIGLLYWYNKLKNRYARLIRLEKTIGD